MRSQNRRQFASVYGMTQTQPSCAGCGRCSGASTRDQPTGPAGGSKVRPPMCSTSVNAAIVSTIGTSTHAPSPSAVRAWSAASADCAIVMPHTLSATT